MVTEGRNCNMKAGSSSGQVYNDCQRVVYTKYPENNGTIENGSNGPRDGFHHVTSQDWGGAEFSASDTMASEKDHNPLKDSMWMIDSSSQAYSGPEDNSTDPHETLTETSTLTFMDAHTNDESGESHSFHGLGAGMVYVKEFVLIDDDDDGDMSLREKTVTDLSMMNGNAADLVCGRLLSTSSASLSECKESPAPEVPPPEGVESLKPKSRGCCFCTIV